MSYAKYKDLGNGGDSSNNITSKGPPPQQMPPQQQMPQQGGLPFTKLTISDAIGLVTLRLGRVEQFIIDFE